MRKEINFLYKLILLFTVLALILPILAACGDSKEPTTTPSSTPTETLTPMVTPTAIYTPILTLTPNPTLMPTPTLTPTLTPRPTPTPVPTPKVWSDGKVGIILNEVVRVDSWPSQIEYTNMLNASYARKDSTIQWVHSSLHSLKEGCDYIAIHLTIAHIEVAHMGYYFIGTPTGLFGNTPTWETNFSKLVDINRYQYEELAYFARDVTFSNLGDLSLSCELIEGTTMILVFELPKSAKPINLSFAYPFSNSSSWQTWEDKSIMEWGQIDVGL